MTVLTRKTLCQKHELTLAEAKCFLPQQTANGTQRDVNAQTTLPKASIDTCRGEVFSTSTRECELKILLLSRV